MFIKLISVDYQEALLDRPTSYFILHKAPCLFKEENQVTQRMLSVYEAKIDNL